MERNPNTGLVFVKKVDYNPDTESIKIYFWGGTEPEEEKKEENTATSYSAVLLDKKAEVERMHNIVPN